MTRIYEFIHSEEGNYPIAWMCQWAKVSKSGYYNWLSPPESATAVQRRELAGYIKKIFDESDGTYGYRRIAATLDWQGVPADPDTVRSIMRELGLKAARPRRKVCTTVPAEDLDERPDLVQRDSRCRGPRDQVGWGYYLHSYLGGIRVPGDGFGLLHEEGGGVGSGGSYAHRTGVRGHRHGGA
ncbi:IS3 family transposase [Actinomyces ruminis]|uniref:HTH-like domain-containing protein n=1 Tax=Actinomyces ruminis TaxID=1937003 RepID=A0ABX4MC47_9ACTO|nr:IS3 family transposase [Actinomyces ruminis]PHP53044.1 hypothetical protein BW737_005380 [Actinomyces ruminis]